MGAHFAHHITTCPPPGFSDLATALHICFSLKFMHETTLNDFSNYNFLKTYIMKTVPNGARNRIAAFEYCYAIHFIPFCNEKYVGRENFSCMLL